MSTPRGPRQLPPRQPAIFSPRIARPFFRWPAAYPCQRRPRTPGRAAASPCATPLSRLQAARRPGWSWPLLFSPARRRFPSWRFPHVLGRFRHGFTEALADIRRQAVPEFFVDDHRVHHHAVVRQRQVLLNLVHFLRVLVRGRVLFAVDDALLQGGVDLGERHHLRDRAERLDLASRILEDWMRIFMPLK